MHHNSALHLLWLLAALVALAGCRDDAPEATRGELVVFAASSLTEAFQELERGFEREHPEVDVRLTFAGSQVLRLQIEQGAAADVFASANEDHMRALVAAGRVAEPRRFAMNELVVIVPRDNPAKIARFADLARASRLVIGADTVPVGVYTQRMLSGGGLDPAFVRAVRQKVVSKESNVRLVRAKVALGEADAAIVYRTDGVASEEVRVVPLPEAVNVRASYWIGPLTEARGESAARFVAYTLSAEGQRVLARHGFVREGGR